MLIRMQAKGLRHRDPKYNALRLWRFLAVTSSSQSVDGVREGSTTDSLGVKSKLLAVRYEKVHRNPAMPVISLRCVPASLPT